MIAGPVLCTSFRALFPGSAWERIVLPALPAGCEAEPRKRLVTRQSLVTRARARTSTWELGDDRSPALKCWATLNCPAGAERRAGAGSPDPCGTARENHATVPGRRCSSRPWPTAERATTSAAIIVRRSRHYGSGWCAPMTKHEIPNDEARMMKIPVQALSEP
jgi:hypothetical protein